MGAHLLGAEGLHLEYPTRVVLDRVTLGVNEGDRIGVVGRNGDGKSSLLGVLAGTIAPQDGRVTRRNGLRVGLLSQADTLDPAESVEHAVIGDRPEYEWAGQARIRDIIAGLVADIDWHATMGSLSGGQRRRVGLAALLVGEWDLLILDEPTNHLDVEAITWLAGHLTHRWPQNAGGLLVVTHDRWFLDEVCTATWEVHDGVVEPFEGGYAAYVLARVERDRIAAAAEARRQNLMRKELAWLRRGAPARTSKPRFRVEAANELIADVPPVRNPLELQRLAVARLGRDVVDLEDVGVSFDGREVLREITWHIGPGERTGVLGANGAGKSTLLGLIAGTVEPTSGHVRRGGTVRVGILDQQFSRLAEIGSDRVREVLARTRTSFRVDGRNLTPAQLLERLGFAHEHLSARVEELSGGQRRRLQILLLLLDEYLRLRAEERAAAAGGEAPPATAAAPDGPSGAEVRAMQKQSRAVERRMDKLAAARQELQEEMAAADPSDYETLAQQAARLQAMDAETAELEERWLALAERLDRGALAPSSGRCQGPCGEPRGRPGTVPIGTPWGLSLIHI